MLTQDERLTAFQRRCLQRVAAVRSKKMQLIDAIDALQMSAVREGLVRKFGQHEIQRILGEVFGGAQS